MMRFFTSYRGEYLIASLMLRPDQDRVGGRLHGVTTVGQAIILFLHHPDQVFDVAVPVEAIRAMVGNVNNRDAAKIVRSCEGY